MDTQETFILWACLQQQTSWTRDFVKLEVENSLIVFLLLLVLNLGAFENHRLFNRRNIITDQNLEFIYSFIAEIAINR